MTAPAAQHPAPVPPPVPARPGALPDAARANAPPADAGPTPHPTPFWDGGRFDFGDILDAINPLQHIPIVSAVYRAVTGDTIGVGPRMLGDLLFGGVIGFIASAVNVMVQSETGKDVGEHVVATLFGDDGADDGDAPAAETLLAAAPSASPTVMIARREADLPAPPADDPKETPAEDADVNKADLDDPDLEGLDLQAPPRPAAPWTLPRRETVRSAAHRPDVPPAVAVSGPAPGASGPRPARESDSLPAFALGRDDSPAAIRAALRARPTLLLDLPAGPHGAGSGSDSARRHDGDDRADGARRASETAPPPGFTPAWLAGGRAPGPWIAEAMRYGLDRYAAMARAARETQPPTVDGTF